MCPFESKSFADCARQHAHRSRKRIADPNNLFHRGSLLSGSFDEALRGIALVMQREGSLRDARTRLVDLAADALLIVDAIDAADGHVGAVLLEPTRQAA